MRQVWDKAVGPAYYFCRIPIEDHIRIGVPYLGMKPKPALARGRNRLDTTLSLESGRADLACVLFLPQ